ncbi:MAG: hypothetical protein PHR26_02135 [Candidatus ainarchaeum sp.]|nr:hypothetical protein [Candidatus ainarchaeum sp.]MDD3975827.1 hypothetical protein [Candidatus ainarchaeum sp.]
MPNISKRTYVPGLTKCRKFITTEYINAKKLDSKKLTNLLNSNIAVNLKVDVLEGFSNHNNVSIIKLLNNLEINKNCKKNIINFLKKEI